MRPLLILLPGVVTCFAIACISSEEPSGDTTQQSSASSTSSSGDMTSTSSGDPGSMTARGSSGTPSVGCGTAGITPGFKTNQMVTVGSGTRTYAINVPANYDASKHYPVIFAYHGNGGTGAGMKGVFNFEAKHDAEAIFVYPDAVGGGWTLDKWDATNNPDIAFLESMITSIGAKYCVNTDRVFATGFSNGAFFANHIGCVLGSKIRAVAAHSGGGPYTLNGEHYMNGKLICKSPKPKGVMIIIGDQDGLLSDTEASRVVWTGNLSCQSTQNASTPTPCKQYAGCSSTFKTCVIPGLGHQAWSQGSDTIWNFFAAL